MKRAMLLALLLASCQTTEARAECRDFSHRREHVTKDSTHLPCASAAISDTPVMFPPGRAKLPIIPVSTGLATIATMGISRVACCAARAHGV